MDLVKFVNEQTPKNALPTFNPGDTVTVHYKIKEGAKERIQQYQGVVIQRNGVGANETFTVRKVSNSIGVERIFPISSPFLDLGAFVIPICFSLTCLLNPNKP